MSDIYARFLLTGRLLAADAAAWADRNGLSAGIPPWVLTLCVLCLAGIAMFYFLRGVRGIIGIIGFLLVLAALVRVFVPGWLL